MAQRVRMMMDLECGFIKCDIHGDHHPHLILEGYKGMSGEARYNIVRFSGCYGDKNWMGLSKTVALEILDEQSFMPHTRHAYRRLARAKKMVDCDAIKSPQQLNKFPEMDTQVRVPEPPTPAPTWNVAIPASYDEATLISQGNLYHEAVAGSPLDAVHAMADSGRWLSIHTRQTNLTLNTWESELLADDWSVVEVARPDETWDEFLSSEESPF